VRKLERISAVISIVLILSLVAIISPALSNTTTVKAATTAIDKSKVTIYVGKTATLRITGTTDTILWTSSKKSVATVSAKGKVTAKKAGTTTITATVNSEKYTCKVTVKAAKTTQTTVYGKVTAISGTKVTIALGTMNTPSEAKPSGTPDIAKPTGTPNEVKPTGTPNEAKPTGAPRDAGELLTLTGKSITINISDSGILTKWNADAGNAKPDDSTSTSNNPAKEAPGISSSTAVLSDIVKGSILKVTYKGAIDSLVTVEIMQ
jgi:hypothetical protein